MAILPLFLLVSVIFNAEAQQTEQSVFRPGSFLTPTGTNTSWLSRSGRYAFGFYKHGNGYAIGIFIAEIPQNTVVWTANRDNPPLLDNVKLNFTSDGRLVLQTAQGMETEIANNTKGAAAASMLDSGNFVLYNSDNSTKWQSFDKPTDTFLPGQKLTTDQVMFSSLSDTNKSTGIFRLIMQQDGWLAMYPVKTPIRVEYGYWGAGVSGEGSDVTLHFDDDGRLYLLNGSLISIVNITAGDPTKDLIYRLTIDPDGILRHYSHNMSQNGVWNVTWSGPKDDCGINGFSDQDVGCQCLPGFKRVNQDSWASGCERNFDPQDCKSNENATGYTMEAELQIVWKIDSYSTLNSSTQDACGDACLRDCDCEAALYKDGECRKLRLPLTFGRRIQGNSAALIKVGNSPLTPDQCRPKECKKNNRRDILIIGVTLISLACVILAISGIAFYKYRVWLYRSIFNSP